MAVHTCIEEIMDIHNTLRYLGVPLYEKCFMFDDNESVVNSASIPHDKLHKRHIAFSFHRVRKYIAAGVISFKFLVGKKNPADILSKHWGYQQDGKYYNPYSSGGEIAWTSYPIRIMMGSRMTRPIIALSLISMGSDRIYTCIP